VCYNVLQCVAVCCSAYSYTHIYVCTSLCAFQNAFPAIHRVLLVLYLLQHTATHCNTLQHTATHCNTTATDHHQKYNTYTLQYIYTQKPTYKAMQRKIGTWIVKYMHIYICTQYSYTSYCIPFYTITLTFFRYCIYHCIQ